MAILKVLHDGSLDEIEFDNRLWEQVDVPESFVKEHDVPNKTLKYVGPVIDGKITCDVPDLPFYYKTFADLMDLKEFPEKWKYPTNYYHPFEGCNNLVPCAIVDHISGFKIGGIYDGVQNDEIVSSKSSLFELLTKISDISREKIKAVFGTFGYRDDGFLRDSVTAIGEVLGELVQEMGDKHLILSDGKYIDIFHVSKSSEITGRIAYASTKCIISSRWSMNKFADSSLTIWIPRADFEVDDGNMKLLNKFNQALVDAELIDTFVCDSDSTVIKIDGDCSIESNDGPAIQVISELTITGSGTLKLRGGIMQPAIGVRTVTKVSWGRWYPGDGNFKKLVIDGVTVECKESVKNFTLGKYGTNELPEIEIRNGGKLIAPEMRGKRKMVQSGAEDLVGSTKRSNPAIYEIEERGTAEMSLF